MFNYCEVVSGGIHNRDLIVEIIKGSQFDIDYNNELLDKKEKTDCYVSLFRYPEKIDHVKGYNREVFSDFLFWDLDNSNLTQAVKDINALIDTLNEISKERVKLYFSGNKGFHVTFYCPELELIEDKLNFHIYYKKACDFFAGSLESYDSSIYNKNRIIRAVNSIHPKTGKYKVYLPDGYASIDDIDSLGSIPVEHKIKQYEKRFISDLEKLIDELSHQKINDEKKVNLMEGLKNGFEEGQRNNGLASMAGYLHSKSISSDVLRVILHDHNNCSSNPLPYREVDSIVSSITRYNNAPTGIEYTFHSMNDGYTKWKNLTESSGDFSLGERFPHINTIMNTKLVGDLTGIVADSGVGKSTVAMDFGNEIAKARGGNTLMFSLEMASHACFFRGATISHMPDEYDNISSYTVKQSLLSNEEIKNTILEEWSNFYVYDGGSISLTDMYNIAQSFKKQHGNLSAVVVDYAQYIDGASDISKSQTIARNVKDLMKSLEAYGIIVMQTNKSIPNMFTEVQDTHIEGVKAWKQSCDYLIGLWKSRDNKYTLHGKFLKTRWGDDGQRFDLIRKGLKYRSTLFNEDVTYEKMKKTMSKEIEL